jgi:ABC-type maltose transport system permease subunit
MEGQIATLQEFMYTTKNITYLVIIAALILFPIFWRFLTSRDD